MSLAATLASNGGRPASFLPAVKCSDCGVELEISEMGSHICGPAPPDPPTRGHFPTMSNPFTLRKFGVGGQQNRANSSSPSRRGDSSPNIGHAPKPSRPALPRINSDAANKPFLAPNPNLASPISPAVSMRSGSSNGGKPPFARSMTSPMPRLWDPRPPSPELSANLDCAFPPFPTSANSARRPSTSHGRKTPNGSERSTSRAASRLDQVRNASPEPFNLEPPESPRVRGTENVMQKMNTMKSGPFGNSRRNGSGDSGNVPGDRRRRSQPEVDEPPPRPSTASSDYSQARRPSLSQSEAGKKVPPQRPDRPVDGELSPTFLNSFSAEPISMPVVEEEDSRAPFARSNTFPSQSAHEAEEEFPLAKTRSEPAFTESDSEPMLPQTTFSGSTSLRNGQPLPPRSDSRSGNRMDYRMHDAPPVPKAIQQYRQESTHSPSESSSSTASHSTPMTSNGGLSPISSVGSSIDAFPSLNFDSGKHGEDEKMRVAGLSVKNQQTPGMRAEQPPQRSPPSNSARSGVMNETPRKVEEATFPMESPMDPALQQMQNLSGPPYEPWQSSGAPGGRPPAPTRTQTAPFSNGREPFPPALSIPKHVDLNDMSSRSAPPMSRARSPSMTGTRRNASPNSLQPPPIPQDPHIRRPPARRGTNAKAPCRGCGQIIEGKSVKAADGRLTGRWHKACFVCRSCKQPFTTADFYVINNEPYCEQHYHEQNGSLCHGCNRGIEGEFLETSSSTRFGSMDKKFHPRCFTCSECRMVLAQDYFEIKGSVYCERHALAAMRAQARLGAGGGLNPPDQRGLMAERRTTKLMMMS